MWLLKAKLRIKKVTGVKLVRLTDVTADRFALSYRHPSVTHNKTSAATGD
jgi:hypothetical protein